MGMGQEEKETLLDELLRARRNGDKLEIRLRFKGEAVKAAEVRAKARELSKEIDTLLASLMNGWIGSAEQETRRLREVNAGIRGVIEEIKHEIDVAKSVAKALGYLDDAIRIAMKLMA
jgi:hypothetical protein